VHKNILKYIIGTTRLKLNKSELEQVKIWVPAMDIIENIVKKLNIINHGRSEASQVIKNTQSLQKSLINQIF
jgi:restriction endonuclease S subunit